MRLVTEYFEYLESPRYAADVAEWGARKARKGRKAANQ